MDLLQLKYFVKIVEHRSFTKAAQDCNVSQPALSQQIRKLEKQLGKPLLERNARCFHLTPGGHLLLESAKQILGLVADTESHLIDDGECGRLSVSAIPTIGPYFLPEVFERLNGQFKKARIVIGEDLAESLLQRCRNGEIDIGLLALPADTKQLPVDSTRLSVEPLFEESLLIAMAHDHPLIETEKLTVADIQYEPMVMLSDEHCLSRAIELFCNHQQMQPVSVGRIRQLETIKQLVARGQGISFVPEMASRDSLNGRLVYRRLSGSQAVRTIAICWNKARYRSQLLTNAIKAARELGDSASPKKVAARVKQRKSVRAK